MTEADVPSIAAPDADDLESKFLAFCVRALGSDPESPLKEANGATVTALVAAFKSLRYVPKPATSTSDLPSAQTFDDPIYSEPWSVYLIRNMVTGTAYVGSAAAGFLARYPKARWWKGHHNKRLVKDSVAYGRMNFRVLVYVCLDAADMRRQESELMRANRLYTYNLRTEADNR